MKKNTDHCVFHDNVMLCKHCGAEEVLTFPLEVMEFTKKVKAFIKLHKDCEPAPAEQTKGTP